MRYRSRESVSPPVTVPRRIRTRSSCTAAFGPWTLLSSTTWVPSEVKKEIWDVEIVNFKALQKQCGSAMLPINPVTIRTTSVERTPGGVGLRQFSNLPSCWIEERVSDSPYWWETGWLVEVPGFDENLIDAVRTSAIAQLRAASYDALTDLVELRKSVDLFRQLSSKMDSFLNKVIELVREEVARRKLKRKILRIPLGEVLSIFQKVASDYWLKYRYGVKPVLYSLVDVLESQRNLKGGLIRERASRTESLSKTETLTWESAADATTSTTQTLHGTRIYRATAYGRVDVQGLGSFDPIVTAWETLKWSFILDWLIDVGSYLQAISPFAQVTTQAVCVSVKTTVERRQSNYREWHNYPPSNRAQGNTGVSQTIETTQEYMRWAPGTSVPWPVFSSRLNLPRIADLVAIAVGLKNGVNERLLRI